MESTCKVLNQWDNSNLFKLMKRANRYGRTEGPTLIIEKLRFSKTNLVIE